MKYFRLDYTGGKWIETEYDPRKEHVKIYDYVNGKMQLKGLGQY